MNDNSPFSLSRRDALRTAAAATIGLEASVCGCRSVDRGGTTPEAGDGTARVSAAKSK